jgi:two-component system LytT family response regulator
MRALVIDDEQKARDVLELLLQELCPDIEEILKASRLEEGVQLIKQFQPDVVFLDIEMPEHSGLEIIDFFKGEAIDFHIIFTTAYNKYAIEAFKISAIDYLLKPIADDELISAMHKAKKLVDASFIDHKLNDLEKAFHQLSVNKIAIDVAKGISFIPVDDIVMFRADGAYTKVCLKNGKSELISKSLKHFTQQLENNILFYKPHRSYLINLKFMERLVKEDGYYIELSTGHEIPIARDKRDAFLQLVEKIF